MCRRLPPYMHIQHNIRWPLLVVCLLMFTLLLGLFLQRPNRDTFTLNQWLNGTAAQQIEQEILDGSTMLKTLSKVYKAALYWAFHEGSKGVLIGEDGWLFTTEEFITDPVQADQILRANLDEVVTTIQQLRAQDISVIVALLPDKSRILPNQLGNYQQDRHARTRYNLARRVLLSAGIYAPDLRPPFLREDARNLFFKADTHWTPEGSQQVAKALSNEIRWTLPTLVDNASFLERGFTRQYHRGDLADFIPANAMTAPEELYYTAVIEQPEDTASPQSLFAEDTPDIALIGTSFSANARWNFVDQLRLHLQSDVLNLAQEGKGVLLPMREIRAEGFFVDTPPKLLIWEIPERYLSRMEGK